jgi:DNA-binding MarR family transcriptional regulator
MPGRSRTVSTSRAAAATSPAEPSVDRGAGVDGARAMSRLSRYVERALGRLDLSIAQFRVLDVLSQQNEGGRALAEWLAVKPASVTTVVDGLVGRGLVERRADPSDRRRVTHELTPDGRRVHGEATSTVADQLASIASYAEDGVDPDALLATLSVWSRALDRARQASRATAAAGADPGPERPERPERRG